MDNCQQSIEDLSVDADPVTLQLLRLSPQGAFSQFSHLAVSFSVHCSALPHLSQLGVCFLFFLWDFALI